MNILSPEFYSEFSCICSDCEEHCCQGWKISLDKKTFKTYKKHSSKVIKKIADENLILLRNSTSDWGMIKLNEDNECPALTEDKLCSIHKELGPKGMATLCKEFPRIVRKSQDTLKNSLSLACPEAVRKVLFSPSALSCNVEHVDKELEGKRPPWFQKVHADLIEIAINDRLSVNEILFAIGLIVDKLPEKPEENAESFSFSRDLIGYSDSIKSLAATGKCSQELDKVEVTAQFHGKFFVQYLMWIKSFCQIRLKANARGAKTLLDMVSECLPYDEINDDNAKSLSDYYDGLRKSWKDIVEPYFNQEKHILINLIVYILYDRDFPLGTPDSSPKEEYLRLVVDFVFLRGMLSAIAIDKGSIDDTDIVNILYSYYSNAAHSNSFQETAKKLLEELGMTIDVAPLLLSKY